MRVNFFISTHFHSVTLSNITHVTNLIGKVITIVIQLNMGTEDYKLSSCGNYFVVNTFAGKTERLKHNVLMTGGCAAFTMFSCVSSPLK